MVCSTTGDFGEEKCVPSTPLQVDENVLKSETRIFPEVHPHTILGVMPFLIVLPCTQGFPASQTLGSFSYVINMPFAFVLVAEGAFAHATIPFPSRTVKGGCG